MITEVDGPPLAYFEITDGEQIIRRVYRILRAPTREALEDNIDKLRAELIRVDDKGQYANSWIFWRKRPVIISMDVNEGRSQLISGYCRLTTSPPLPNAFWETIGWDKSGTGDSPP